MNDDMPSDIVTSVAHLLSVGRGVSNVVCEDLLNPGGQEQGYVGIVSHGVVRHTWERTPLLILILMII